MSEQYGPDNVRINMIPTLFDSLESLLAIKRQRLSVTRSPRSRDVLRRQIRSLRHQISALTSKR